MRIFILLLLVLLLVPHSTVADDKTEEQIRIIGIAQTLESTVKVEVTGNGLLQLSTGSGFYVSADKVLTNVHVVMVAGLVTIKVSRSDGTVCKAKPGYQEYGLDLMLLTVDCLGNPLTVASGAEVGQDVYVIGSSVLDNAVSSGIVSKLDQKGHIVANVFADKGNSGGPMIDSSGAVIGVLRGKDGPDWFVYGIKSQDVIGFLRRAGI